MTMFLLFKDSEVLPRRCQLMTDAFTTTPSLKGPEASAVLKLLSRENLLSFIHVFNIFKADCSEKAKALYHWLWQTHSLVVFHELPKLIKMCNLESNNRVGHCRNLHFPDRRQTRGQRMYTSQRVCTITGVREKKLSTDSHLHCRDGRRFLLSASVVRLFRSFCLSKLNKVKHFAHTLLGTLPSFPAAALPAFRAPSPQTCTFVLPPLKVNTMRSDCSFMPFIL